MFDIMLLSGFKSYYVVWKQNPKIIGTTLSIQFKSYYVVWKLNRENAKTEKEKSLNRTM